MILCAWRDLDVGRWRQTTSCRHIGYTSSQSLLQYIPIAMALLVYKLSISDAVSTAKCLYLPWREVKYSILRTLYFPAGRTWWSDNDKRMKIAESCTDTGQTELCVSMSTYRRSVFNLGCLGHPSNCHSTKPVLYGHECLSSQENRPRHSIMSTSIYACLLFAYSIFIETEVNRQGEGHRLCWK